MRFGANFGAALKGRTIIVTGVARRETVWFAFNAQRNGKYCHQTHVEVTDAKQIAVAG